MKTQITRVKGSDKVPLLLVGNKVDLENQREVNTIYLTILQLSIKH